MDKEFNRTYDKDLKRYLKHGFKVSNIGKVATISYLDGGYDCVEQFVDFGIRIKKDMPKGITARLIGIPFWKNMSKLLKATGEIWNNMNPNEFRFRLYPTRNAKDLHGMIFS